MEGDIELMGMEHLQPWDKCGRLRPLAIEVAKCEDHERKCFRTSYGINKTNNLSFFSLFYFVLFFFFFFISILFFPPQLLISMPRQYQHWVSPMFNSRLLKQHRLFAHLAHSKSPRPPSLDLARFLIRCRFDIRRSDVVLGEFYYVDLCLACCFLGKHHLHPPQTSNFNFTSNFC